MEHESRTKTYKQKRGMNMKRDIIKDSPIFKGLSDVEMAMFDNICTEKDYETGERILDRGSQTRELCIMSEGTADVYIKLPLYAEALSVYTLKKGEFFGEMSFMDGLSRSASIKSSSKSKVIIIQKEDFDCLIEENNHIGLIIMKNMALILCDRLRKTDDELTSTFKRQKDAKIHSRLRRHHSRLRNR